MTNTTTDQKQDASREAFENAWKTQFSNGMLSKFRELETIKAGSKDWAYWGWQARGEYEAQQLPDLRAVREASQYLQRQFEAYERESTESIVRHIAALLATPQAAQEDAVERERLLTDMRMQVSYSHVATMPIPLYERIKAALQPATRKEGA